MKNKKELVKRSYNFEVRAKVEEENGKERYLLEGKPVIYDSETDLYFMRETIEKGALDETDLTDVRFLINHDLNIVPLARSRRNNKNSTMQLNPNETGLEIKAYLDIENNANSRMLYSAVDRGDITGMSFMFSIEDEEWEDMDTEKPLHRIKKIASIVEVSAVTFPAYEDTEIYARDKSNLEKLQEKLESEREKVRSLENEKKMSYETRTLLTMYGGN